MKNLTIAAFLITTLTVQAQDRNGPTNSIFSNNLDFFAMQKVDNVTYTSHTNNKLGSPYLFDDWKKVRVFTKHKENFSYAILANYNVQSDYFIVKLDEDKYILNPDSVDYIRLENRIFRVNKNLNRKYYEELADGKKLDLIRIYEVTSIEVPTQTLGLVETKLTLIEKDFFLENDTISKVPKSKNKILKTLKIPKSNLSQLGKLNLKKTEDLSILINTL